MVDAQSQPIVLEGSAFCLRTLSPGDVGSYYVDWMNDLEVTQYLESRHSNQTLESVRSWVAGFDQVNKFVFGIFDRAIDRHIGNVTLYNIDRYHGTAHYGCMVGDKSYWGKGVVTTVLPLLFDFAFGTLGLRKITAGADIRNLSTIVNFKKLSLRREGVFRQHLRDGEAFVDEVRYALFREDWMAHPSSAKPLSGRL